MILRFVLKSKIFIHLNEFILKREILNVSIE